MADPTSRVTGLTSRIRFGTDVVLQRIFRAMPPLDAREAISLGFQADADLDMLANAALQENDPMKIIDLSVAIENDVPADPPGLGPDITYTEHSESIDEVLRFFSGLDIAEVPGGGGWAVEQLN